jgi:hypothetical protein
MGWAMEYTDKRKKVIAAIENVVKEKDYKKGFETIKDLINDPDLTFAYCHFVGEETFPPSSRIGQFELDKLEKLSQHSLTCALVCILISNWRYSGERLSLAIVYLLHFKADVNVVCSFINDKKIAQYFVDRAYGLGMQEVASMLKTKFGFDQEVKAESKAEATQSSDCKPAASRPSSNGLFANLATAKLHADYDELFRQTFSS